MSTTQNFSHMKNFPKTQKAFSLKIVNSQFSIIHYLVFFIRRFVCDDADALFVKV